MTSKNFNTASVSVAAGLQPEQFFADHDRQFADRQKTARGSRVTLIFSNHPAKESL